MRGGDLYARLQQVSRPLGDGELTLVVGDFAIRIEGLNDSVCALLRRRWGGFLERSTPGEPRMTVRVFRGGPEYWLDAPRRGEPYRIEALEDDPHRIVASYHFAVGADERPGTWRVGITDDAREPLERILDNTLRFVTARLAVEEGGFAMHAAGVLHEGRAWLFAGPSRAGKSTVVRLLAPAKSLGDDFGLVLPDRGGWSAPAVPFDNSERVEHEPPAGLIPVAGIWRLYQATETRVESPPCGRAVASLTGCTAFPWAMPELSQRLLEHVERFVTDASFHHLHFTEDAALWMHLAGTG
jgi:hypothetical protein